MYIDNFSILLLPTCDEDLSNYLNETNNNNKVQLHSMGVKCDDRTEHSNTMMYDVHTVTWCTKPTCTNYNGKRKKCHLIILPN